MAAKTPIAFGGTNYCDTLNEIPVYAEGGLEPSGGGSANGFLPKHDLRHRVFRFDNVASGSTWPSGIRGIVCLATDRIGSEALADAKLTTAETGLVTFTTSSGTPDFFLHVWSRD